MRRIVVALLAFVLLVVSVPIPAQTAPSALPANDLCPISFTPAHNASVRVSLPLLVSLEWDARGSTQCNQWQAAMARASSFLEDASGGQIALGPITIEDNAKDWTRADIQVHVQNTSIPDATVGGISADTVDAVGGTPGPAMISPTASLSGGGAFLRGAIRVGRSWSEFGPRRGRWSDPDGYRTIVHELGHYALYLYDEYFGYTGGATPARVPTSCATQLFNPSSEVANPLPQQSGGSLMYWEYALHQFWNGTPSAAVDPSCALSRQWQVYGQPDWQIIAQHYSVTVPSGSTPAAPNPPPCIACNLPAAYHWLFDFAPMVTKQDKACSVAAVLTGKNNAGSPCLLADGFLVKNKDAAVLHEGVPYLPVPPIYHTIPGAPGFYPPYVLEMLGAARGDVARITLTDPANPNEVRQVTRQLDGPIGAALPVPHIPVWYDTPQGAVPLISAQPVVTTSATGTTTLTGLQVTAANPLAVPLRAAHEHGTISAQLFESGQGRQATTTLTLSSSPSGGHEQYTGTIPFDPGNPILDALFYLTPTADETAHEDPDAVTGGAWAMASYSLSCNNPTYFLGEFAPGDEGGLDSADGMVNVHLPSTADIPGLCVGITAQSAAPPAGSLNLDRTYAVQGSSPLPAGTLITFHFDRDSLLANPGSVPSVVRVPLPSKGNRTNASAPTCRVVQGASMDMTAGTYSAVIGAAGAAYQMVLLTPATARSLGQC